ncbi:hypothetical protein AA23498_3462 [Acetobacter nitrogenifigens DSM 23921 = NBRC 105050]|uniref:Uncharacterized protein n=1 Tax=Acetobacter nitrogenifigens DSM 23921 = NBRC 105050 TaxID=1120919 RepID=A0A511XFF2_9PROT|nr:hypothetical protein AA23498_3462 [Acetobacter nitrogenifigens DSM 23921 = NBRC 105050]GEN61669.1 hypothetical protein ANI02nite_35530 [Acetobacter nitrogenifigens DSM 23921 = NBRC 105050]
MQANMALLLWRAFAPKCISMRMTMCISAFRRPIAVQADLVATALEWRWTQPMIQRHGSLPAGAFGEQTGPT